MARLDSGSNKHIRQRSKFSLCKPWHWATSIVIGDRRCSVTTKTAADGQQVGVSRRRTSCALNDRRPFFGSRRLFSRTLVDVIQMTKGHDYGSDAMELRGKTADVVYVTTARKRIWQAICLFVVPKRLACNVREDRANHASWTTQRSLQRGEKRTQTTRWSFVFELDVPFRQWPVLSCWCFFYSHRFSSDTQSVRPTQRDSVYNRTWYQRINDNPTCW